MKKFALAAIIIIASLHSYCQVDSTTPPYKKFPSLPPIQILLGDSVTKFTKENLQKDKPVYLLLFSPDCFHCQQEVQQMKLHKNDLKNIQVVMVSFYPVWQLNLFAKEYGVDQIPNLVLGKDIHFLLAPFYNARSLPFHTFYDKAGNLIDVFEGAMEIKKVLGIFGTDKK